MKRPDSIKYLTWWQKEIDMHEDYVDLEWLPSQYSMPELGWFENDDSGPICEQMWAIREGLV